MGCPGDCSMEYLCPFSDCELKFPKQIRLQRHLRIHTNERPFVCSYENCNRSYTRKEHLKRHLQTSHEKSAQQSKQKCPKCTKEFTSSYNLKKHLKRFHELRKFQCDHCEKSFIKRQHLKIHEYEHTGIKPFVCPDEGCNKSFLYPSKLKSHQKTHKGYECDEHGCSEIIKNWSSFIKHKKSVHGSSYKCETCNKEFSSNVNLKNHCLVHSESREAYHCPMDGCDRFYYFKKNLRQHIKTAHENVKGQYKCPREDCPKHYNNKRRLKRHIQSHDKTGRTVTKGNINNKKSRNAKSIASVLTGFAPNLEKEIPHLKDKFDAVGEKVNFDNFENNLNHECVDT